MTRQSDKIFPFIDKQLASWSEGRLRFGQLNDVLYKSLTVNGVEVKIQFNPERVRSATAQVTATAIKRRQCFLCRKNRPPDQMYLSWRNYQILVNPYPILPRHLTVASARHQPQFILSRVTDMLDLTRFLEGFLVFYNGAQCGASAPDHFHFQAVEAGHTPLERLMDGYATEKTTGMGFSGRLHYFSGKKKSILRDTFETVCREYENSPDAEPMMNVFCRHMHGIWELTVIPRLKHRPECYCGVGDAQMLVSPGALDMAGIVVTARECDFRKLAAENLTQIYRETGCW
ncbi:MAG: DUF4922 domain-containing protein [Bacteroidales bacterium]|jgi:hypothetical protein|nr:DUF4922 domain-containing protein [Bacteroidales bacterium]